MTTVLTRANLKIVGNVTKQQTTDLFMLLETELHDVSLASHYAIDINEQLEKKQISFLSEFREDDLIMPEVRSYLQEHSIGYHMEKSFEIITDGKMTSCGHGIISYNPAHDDHFVDEAHPDAEPEISKSEDYVDTDVRFNPMIKVEDLIEPGAGNSWRGRIEYVVERTYSSSLTYSFKEFPWAKFMR